SAARVRVLSEASSSPTLARLRDELVQHLPGLQWYEWEPVSFDNERDGMTQAFGQVVRPMPRLDRAEIVIALDTDLFGAHPAAMRLAKDGARSGTGGIDAGHMNRVYAIESTFTTTGAVADHRLPLRSELILPIVKKLTGFDYGTTVPAVLQDPKVARFVDAI